MARSVGASAAWLRRLAGPMVLAIAVVVPFVVSPSRNYDLSVMFVYATAILGLTLLTGASGQVSLSQATFIGIGAYLTAILVVKVGLPLWIAGIAAIIITCAFGFAVGLLTARLEGLYLALITLAVALVFAPLIKRFPTTTGGASGLLVGQPQAGGGWPVADDQLQYLLALAMVAGAWFVTRGVLAARPGRALYACQDNPLAAAAMGVNVSMTRAVAFAWSGAMAGLAGVGYVIVVGFVSPESFPLLLSVAILAGMVVGGTGVPVGALLGAAYIQFVPLYTSQISDSAAGVAYGVSLVLVLLLLPGGLASLGGVLGRLRSKASPGFR